MIVFDLRKKPTPPVQTSVETIPVGAVFEGTILGFRPVTGLFIRSVNAITQLDGDRPGSWFIVPSGGIAPERYRRGPLYVLGYNRVHGKITIDRNAEA